MTIMSMLSLEFVAGLWGGKKMEKLSDRVVPSDELKRIGILDTPREAAFDNIVYTASQLFRMPLCAISFIDGERQWFKSSVGLEITETRREDSFCAEAMLSDSLMIVNDTRLDHRFSNNIYVGGSPYVRFYAGQAIFGPGMTRLGTLCVMDRNVRKFDSNDARLITMLAEEVSDLIRIRASSMSENSRVQVDHSA